MTVFITDGLLRKSLSATRSLGDQKVSVTVGEKTRWTPSGFSSFCHHVVTYPDPVRDKKAFARWIVNYLKKNQYQLVLPMDDAIMDIFINMKDELANLTQVILPPKESYSIARNKLKTAMLAKKKEIPSPESYSVSSMDDIEEIVNQISYPAVIKPKESSGSRGIKIVHNEEECLASYKAIHQYYDYPFIQEYIPPGPRYDVCLLFNNQGELRAQFVQKELRHYPIDIGPSTLQESVDYPELIELSLRLMSHIPWAGVVELEFMIDSRDNQPKLMEINPRFWNSLECAHQSGVNFPHMLYEIATKGDVAPVRDYATGIKCSNILIGELLHFITNKERGRLDPPFLAGKRFGVTDDILSKKDFMPIFGFLLASLRYAFNFDMWKLLLKRGG